MKKLFDKEGETYIDVAITVMIVAFVLVFAVNMVSIVALNQNTLMRSVYEKYSPDKKGEEEIPPGSYSVEQILGEKNYPESEKNARHGGRAVLHSEQKKNPEKQI